LTKLILCFLGSPHIILIATTKDAVLHTRDGIWLAV